MVQDRLAVRYAAFMEPGLPAVVDAHMPVAWVQAR